MLFTYPFPRAATDAVQGDYTNLRITADLDLRTILSNINGGKNPGLPKLPPVPTGLPTGGLPTGLPTGLPSVSVPPLPSVCRRPDPDSHLAPGAGPPPAPVCAAGICVGAPAASSSGAYRHEPGPADDGRTRMIRRGVKMQLVAFLAITIVGLSYVSARYVGLGDMLLGSGYVVSADFAESGGIFENAEVTYRGVAVGRVDRLRLADDGVHVDLRIDSGTQVPKDTDRRRGEPVGGGGAVRRPAAAQQRRAVPRRRRPHRRRRTTAPRCTPRRCCCNLDRLVNSVDKRRPGHGHRRAGQRRSPAPDRTCSGCSTPATH